MKFVILSLLQLYKAFVSPFLPPACRFYPTCSCYMAEAVEKHGAVKGTAMGVGRVLRCHPLCKGGYDPVR